MFQKINNSFLENQDELESKHKYLVIPDLHGTYSIYKKIEHYIKNHIDKDTIVIFLGDYFDRGEPGTVLEKEFKDAGSYLLVRDLINLKEWANSNQISMLFLKGNHEIFYEEYYLNDNKEIRDEFKFLDATMSCFDYVFKHDRSFYEKFISFLSDLVPYYVDKKFKYLFVHAGVDPDNKNFKSQVSDETIFWIRDQFLFSTKKLNFTVIFGHTPFSKPYMKSDKIGLDSGVYSRDYFFMLNINNENQKIIKLTKN
ncbi:MAG: hypothetical protein DSZ06_02305 [Sulfurospirillum sp.]|nr:MAG: hypothetical protein DSZ06_02305 [Sulfurospirillum sp.]